MVSPSDVSEPSPTRRRLTVWGLEPVEVILPVLAVLVAVAAVVLLASSNEAAGATMLVGVLVAVGSYRTIQITRQGQITEGFTRAIDQLGNDKLDVRLGGIYALERIARDSREDHPQIMEVLTAYAREHAPWPPRKTDEAEPGEATPAPADTDRPKQPASDVQAVIAVLGRRDATRTVYRLNLESTDLAGAKFARRDKGDFEEAIFRGAHLNGAHFHETILKGVNFEGADLRKARLEGADLEKANLREAHLEGADLESAANLDKADLHGAFYDLSRTEDDYRGTRWPEGFDPDKHGAKRTTSGGTRHAGSAPPV